MRKKAAIQARVETRKIVDRITYNPKKHKNKVIKELRKNLQQKVLKTPVPQAPSASLKFGSLNINGLDIEAGWAVGQLLTTKGFDVSIF